MHKEKKNECKSVKTRYFFTPMAVFIYLLCINPLNVDTFFQQTREKNLKMFRKVDVSCFMNVKIFVL